MAKGEMMYKGKFKYIIFIITTSLFWFSLYAYVPIFPGYIEDLGVSHGMVGIIIGSYGFSQMIIRIPLGIISDRLNKRKLFILLGIISSFLSGLGLWLFSSALSMLFFRALAGIAAASWVAFSVLFSSYYRSDEATKATGYIMAANNFGQVLAMLAGGSAAEIFGARSSFLLAAAAAVLAFISGMLISENKEITRKPLSFAELASVGKSGNLIIVSVLAILSQFVVFATVYGFTPIVAESLGASSAQLGLLSTLSILPGIPAGALSGSYFSNKFGEKKTLFAGFIIAAFSCIAIPFAKSFSVLVITQVIGGFGKGVTLPLLMGLSIKNVEENKRGSAMGFFQAIYGLGMFTGPVAVGFISDIASLNAGFYFTAFICFIAAFTVKLFVKDLS
ncbi:MAG TPA: MFS transporter [Clostridiaceae bacterium]|nr:MFS transporter [Clostridiaceae bacterium]